MRQVIGRWKLRSFSNFQIGLITALPDALESECYKTGKEFIEIVDERVVRSGCVKAILQTY